MTLQMITNTRHLTFKTLITFAFLIAITSLYGQNSDNKKYNILRDSIWLKKNHWSAFNLIQSRTNIDSLSAAETDFKIIPVYKFRADVRYFDYNLNFIDIIEEDTTRVSGFIILNSSIIGYLSGFVHNKNWFVLPFQIFNKDDHLVQSIEYLRPKSKKRLFEFCPFGIGLICYKTNDAIFVFDDKINKFIPVNQYIEKSIGLNNLNRYYLESDSDRSNIIR